MRSAFYPLLGDRIYGPIGNTIDIFAVLATMFGVATSLDERGTELPVWHTGERGRSDCADRRHNRDGHRVLWLEIIPANQNSI